VDECLSHGGRSVVGFGLGAGAAKPPVVPSRAAFAGALGGGMIGALVGIFVGNAVYVAEGPHGLSRSGVNATGPIMAGAATSIVGAAIGAWAATPSTPMTPTT